MKTEIKPELLGHVTYDITCDVCDFGEEFTMKKDWQLDKMMLDSGWIETYTGIGDVHICNLHTSLQEGTKPYHLRNLAWH